MERVQRALDAGGIVGEEEGPYVVSYTSRDLILYALGVGSTSDLRYLYEGSPGFAALPTFPLVLPYKGTSSDIVPFPGELLGELLSISSSLLTRLSTSAVEFPLPLSPSLETGVMDTTFFFSGTK